MLCCAKVTFAAETVRPFTQGSLAELLAAREGKPFILVLWSLDCQYCPTELKMLSELKRSHPNLDVVLVATDTISDAAQLASKAETYGMSKRSNGFLRTICLNACAVKLILAGTEKCREPIFTIEDISGRSRPAWSISSFSNSGWQRMRCQVRRIDSMVTNRNPAFLPSLMLVLAAHGALAIFFV